MTTLCISLWTLKLPSGSFRDFIAPLFLWLFSYNLLHKLSGFGCSTLQRAEFYSYLSNSSDSLGFVFTMMIILALKNLHLTAMSHLWLTQPVSSNSSESGHRSLKSLVGCKLLPKQQAWVGQSCPESCSCPQPCTQHCCCFSGLGWHRKCKEWWSQFLCYASEKLLTAGRVWTNPPKSWNGQ